jgi:tryptophan halogenase
LPDRLAHKIHMFRECGKLVRYEWETFLDPSWLSMYAGFEMLPARHDPRADFYTGDGLQIAMDRMRADVRTALNSAIPHAEFIAEHCAAPPKPASR